jgi:hypothetical protein
MLVSRLFINIGQSIGILLSQMKTTSGIAIIGFAKKS